MAGMAAYESEQDFDERTFSGAVGSEQAGAAWEYLEIDIGERAKGTVVLGESMKFDERGHT